MGILAHRAGQLIIKDTIINYSELPFDVKYKSVTSDKPNTFTVTTYNIDPKNYEWKNDDAVVVSLGYFGKNIKIGEDLNADIGEVCTGKKTKIYNNYDIDKTVEITVTEAPVKVPLSITYQPGTTSTEIINDICRKGLLYLKKIELQEDKIYTNGFTAFPDAMTALKNLAKDSKSKVLFKHKDVFFSTSDKVPESYNIYLSYGSGLEKEPAQIEEKDRNVDFEVECFVIHQIKKGDFIHLESRTFAGPLYIAELEINAGSTWSMKLTCTDPENPRKSEKVKK